MGYVCAGAVGRGGRKSQGSGGALRNLIISQDSDSFQGPLPRPELFGSRAFEGVRVWVRGR